MTNSDVLLINLLPDLSSPEDAVHGLPRPTDPAHAANKQRVQRKPDGILLKTSFNPKPCVDRHGSLIVEVT